MWHLKCTSKCLAGISNTSLSVGPCAILRCLSYGNPQWREREYTIEQFSGCLASGLQEFFQILVIIVVLSNLLCCTFKLRLGMVLGYQLYNITIEIRIHLDHLLIELSIFLIVVLSKLHKSKFSVVSVSSKRPVVSKISAILCSRLESFSATRRLYS